MEERTAKDELEKKIIDFRYMMDLSGMYSANYTLTRHLQTILFKLEVELHKELKRIHRMADWEDPFYETKL